LVVEKRNNRSIGSLLSRLIVLAQFTFIFDRKGCVALGAAGTSAGLADELAAAEAIRTLALNNSATVAHIAFN
jgi:hypothetical protein